MESQEQLSLIHSLNSIKLNILKSTDAETVAYLINQAILEVSDVEPGKFILYDDREFINNEGKQLYISQLTTKSKRLFDESVGLDDLKFDIVATLVGLMLVFTNGGIDHLHDIVSGK